MKNRKINLDRPQIDSKEIQAGMNFGLVMTGYQAMSKPFYKTNWFFGTTGLASIGLIVGGTFAFQSPDETDKFPNEQLLSDAPPEVTTPENKLLAINTTNEPIELDNETVLTIPNQFKHDKIVTPIDQKNNEVINVEKISDVNEEQPQVDFSQTKNLSSMDLSPRINGKLHGDITREDLFDNKGITTGSDVSIIHFELHLIDGLGGKVFEEASNQLNQEMRTALTNLTKGETIYFENIKGKTSDGKVVRLNPLRYVLLN